MEMISRAKFNVGKLSSPFMNEQHFHHWEIFIFKHNLKFNSIFPFIPTFIHNFLWKVVSQDPVINKQTSWSVSTFFQPTILQYTDHKAKTKCYRKQSDRFFSAKSPSDLFQNLLRGHYSFFISVN